MSRFDIFQKSHDDSINVINRHLEFDLNKCGNNDYWRSLEKETKHLITWLFNLSKDINPYFPFFENRYGGYMSTAVGFDSLCGMIHHAIVDDGDICYVNKNWPNIVFRDKYDWKNWYYNEDDYRRESVLSRIKPEYKLPEPIFYKNAYEFTDAFDKWIIEDRSNDL